MHVPTRTAPALVLGAALIALAAACSSSNNNKNNAAPAATNAAANSAAPATTVATVARPATPAVAATIARTATPSVAATVRTATPAAGTTARTATPVAGAAVRTATPGAAAATGGGAIDPAVQQKLEAAALKQSDLPNGFSASGEPDRSTTLTGQVAAYSQTYTQIGQSTSGLNVQAIVVALTAFKDQATAQSSFKDLQSSLSEAAGADIKFTAVPNGPKIGDETLSFQVSGQESGLDVAGYAIIWRDGKAAAALIQVGVPAPTSIDALSGLAQKQDSNLKPVAQ